MLANPDETASQPAAPAKAQRRGCLWAAAAVLLVGGGVWLLRGPIADTLVADQMAARDVPASYRIDGIGLRTQRLSNVVIGDPRRPDLVARTVEIDVGWSLQGPVVDAVRADGVRLYGRWDGKRLRLGAVDKLLPPPSDQAFELPDLVLGLQDARARIETPWGSVGARIDGSGPLRRNFVGKIALTATELALQGCVLKSPSVFGDVRTAGGIPQFAGPVRLAGLACPDRSIRVGKTDLDTELSLTPDLRRWKGQIGGKGDAVRLPIASIGGATIETRFDGTAAKTSASFSLSARQLDFGGTRVASAKLSGEGIFAGPVPSATARLNFEGAAVAEADRRRWSAMVAKGDHPLAEIGKTHGRTLITALGDITGQADLTLAKNQLAIGGINLRGRGGVTLTGGADSRLSLAFGGKQPDWRVDGRWRLGGGGLPQTALALRASRNGLLDGTLTLALLVAGASRLSLAPVRITRGRAGALRLTTRGLFSGPLAGGKVDGLGVGIDATIDAAGNVTLAGGCQRVTLAGASIAGARLGSNSVQLCAARGQPLLAWRGGRLSGEIALPAPQIRGRTGDAAFTLRAEQGDYSLGNGGWGLDSVEVTVGEGDAATNLTAAKIVGDPEAGGQAGRLEGGAGTIGTIPLVMSDIAGDWRWQEEALTLTGGLAVSDEQAPPRFNPLVSSDAALTFRDGAIEATANFAESETRTPIGRADLRHGFDSGTGSADLLIMAMRFNDKFQPEQLTPLALGVIANARGTLAGRGRIDWTPDGVTSSGSFTTAGSDFAAAFGSVSGASTTLVFDDLLGLRSAPGQRISLDEVNPGFPIFGGLIDYQLIDATNIRIEGGRWPFAGGELVLKPTVLDFDVNAVRRLEFELRGVDAAVFLTELGFENINASGVFDGVLPVEFSGLGGRIVEGRLVARPGGGGVAYVGELSNYNLGTLANFTFNMLKSLRYEEMTLTLNGDLDGEMATDVKIVGLKQGAGASRNIITRQIEKLPILFNVRINAPFRQLLSSAKSFYDPTILIDQNLPALIEAQRRGNQPPVQPAESETVP